MRTETRTRTLYKFSELSPEAQRRALEKQAQYEAEDFDPEFVYDDAEETVKECLRDFADWIYKQLEAEYDYRTGEESCREEIEANDYEFTEKGDMA